MCADEIGDSQKLYAVFWFASVRFRSELDHTSCGLSYTSTTTHSKRVKSQSIEIERTHTYLSSNGFFLHQVNMELFTSHHGLLRIIASIPIRWYVLKPCRKMRLTSDLLHVGHHSLFRVCFLTKTTQSCYGVVSDHANRTGH